MTQPPLSRQVQKLERAVGVRLLERDNRNVALTAAGTAFLADARRMLGLAEGAIERTRRIHAGSAGTVRIGFTATAAFGVLPALLDQVGRTCPDIDLDLAELVTREQLAGLQGGDLDLGLARPPVDADTFASRLLHREALLLAVPAGHPLTDGQRAGTQRAGTQRADTQRAGTQRADTQRAVRPEEVVNEPLIMYAATEARYFYDLVVRLVPVSEQHVVHSVSQVLTMLWLVAAGRGVAFVPASATRLGIDGVRFLRLDGLPDEPVELHLLWLRGSANPALHTVLQAIGEDLDRSWQG